MGQNYNSGDFDTPQLNTEYAEYAECTEYVEEGRSPFTAPMREVASQNAGPPGRLDLESNQIDCIQ